MTIAEYLLFERPVNERISIRQKGRKAKEYTFITVTKEWREEMCYPIGGGAPFMSQVSHPIMIVRGEKGLEALDVDNYDRKTTTVTVIS